MLAVIGTTLASWFVVSIQKAWAVWLAVLAVLIIGVRIFNAGRDSERLKQAQEEARQRKKIADAEKTIARYDARTARQRLRDKWSKH